MSSARNHQQKPFTLYCDETILPFVSESIDDGSFDAADRYNDDRADSPLESIKTKILIDDDSDIIDQYADPRRRVSNITATSVSSLPCSESESHYIPTQGPRLPLRSPGIRRTRLNASYSDRLSHHRNFRATSPRKSVHVRASPRPRTRERQDEVETMLYPLVLLHITVLPLILPWTQDVVKQALSKAIIEDLAFLKGRLSDTILQRGILVPHPQEDFDLLTERILDALELESSTTKVCTDYEDGIQEEYESNHRARADSYSLCNTCGETTCFSNRPEKRWEVRIFAANGLLRADAWEAAWSEMERVDVEITPYISDAQRRMLDEIQVEADAEKATQAAWSHRQRDIESIVPFSDAPRVYHEQPTSLPEREISEAKQGATEILLTRHDSVRKARPTDQAIPAAYKAKDIPLGILIKNYLYLLAQDRRKMAILFLVLTMVFATVQGMSAQRSIMAMDTGSADRWVDHRVLSSAESGSNAWSSLQAQGHASRRTLGMEAGVVESFQAGIANGDKAYHEGSGGRTPSADGACELLRTVRAPSEEETDWAQHCRVDTSVFDMMCMRHEAE